MSKEIKVSKINIQIGETEVSITPKQARQLRKALDEVLGKDTLRVERERVVDRYPYTWPNVTWISGSGTNAGYLNANDGGVCHDETIISGDVQIEVTC